MALILVRHTETATPHLILGQSDAPLSVQGASRVGGIVESLPRARRVVTSDLGRCRVLAEALGRHLGVECEIDARWREQSFGVWEGRSWEEVDGRSYLEAWTSATPPGGESIGEVVHRVDAALRDVDDETTVVSHAGPIRCALSITRDIGLEEAFAIDIPFGSWRSL